MPSGRLTATIMFSASPRCSFALPVVTVVAISNSGCCLQTTPDLPAHLRTSISSSLPGALLCERTWLRTVINHYRTSSITSITASRSRLSFATYQQNGQVAVTLGENFGPPTTFLEPLSQIARRIPTEKGTTDQDSGPRTKGVYPVEIEREDSDADTDDQKGIRGAFCKPPPSLSSREVTADQQRYKVKDTQSDVPAHAHKVGGSPFVGKGHLIDQKGVASKNPNFNRNQNRFHGSAALTLIDVSPEKFEGKEDSELVPMDVDQVVRNKRRDDTGRRRAIRMGHRARLD